MFVGMTLQVFEKKLEALQPYRVRLGDDAWDTMTWRDYYYGKLIGERAAEAFYVAKRVVPSGGL
jgi:hypothetical protein